MNWPVVKLGDISRPKQWPTLAKKEMIDAGYVVYGANGPIGFTDQYTHTRETILVGCRGSCGSLHIMPAKSYANGNAMAIDELESDRVDIQYLYRVLQARGFGDVITGTSQPQIIKSNIERINIPLPPLPEQKRIAGILDQADALRRLRARALEKLSTLGQAIFQEMFGNVTLNPMGWPIRPVGEVCTRVSVGVVVKPASYYQEAGVPAIRGTNIKESGINTDDLVYFTTDANEGVLRKSRIWAGDVVAVRSGRPGLAAVVPPELDGVNSIDVLIATPNADFISPEFLRDFINSPGGRRMVLAESRGQVQQHFNVKSLSEAKIIIPPRERLHEYGSRLAVLSDKARVVHSSSMLMNNLFTSLQHRAFRGEL